MKPSVLILSACFAFGDSAVASSFEEAKDEKRAKQLETEKRKLDRTKDPADRAESLMKIADITLTYVGDAIMANDLPKLESFVEEYQDTVTVARDTMMSSGLDPYKKPKGYKVVELGTRKHLRILEDAARQLGLAERRILEETLELVSKIRKEFVRVLFR